MIRNYTILIAYCVFSAFYSMEALTFNSQDIINTWIWEKSIGGTRNPYIATPETIGFNKKIVFTRSGRVITYKNDIEIRDSPYEIEKGIGYIDKAEHDLITFEGKTYIIENVDRHSLTIITNNEESARTIYVR